jgi:hypothetical protein
MMDYNINKFIHAPTYTYHVVMWLLGLVDID